MTDNPSQSMDTNTATAQDTTNTQDLFLHSLVSAISSTVGDAFTQSIVQKNSTGTGAPDEKPEARVVRGLLDWTTRDFGSSFTESVARRAYLATLSMNPTEQKEILSLIPEHLLQKERSEALSGKADQTRVLAQTNANLEKIVLQRTEELEEANEQLKRYEQERS